jgi:prepilin-type N-terminal cleavage/methylation domain-containing protein
MRRRLDVREVRSREGGFTLTEVLVALVILGVAVFGVVGAMGASMVASDVHRKTVTADSILRSYAERLNGAVYQECATTAVAQYQPAGVGVTVPAGFTASVTNILYWNGDGSSSAPATFSANCATAPDFGVQQITIQVTANDGRAKQQVTILKRRL